MLILFFKLVLASWTKCIRTGTPDGTELAINLISHLGQEVTGCNNCQLAGTFAVNTPESCASICNSISECSTWKYVDQLISDNNQRGITFGPSIPNGVCSLYSVIFVVKPDLDSLWAPRDCAPDPWPNCYIENSAFESTSITFRADITYFVDVLLLSTGVMCDYNNCENTTRTEVYNLEACSEICSSIKGCEHWQFQIEEEVPICSFFSSITDQISVSKSITGSSSCTLKRNILKENTYNLPNSMSTFGSQPNQIYLPSETNPLCWTNGFNPEYCCSKLYGPNGNINCWNDIFTFDGCCEFYTEL